MKEILNEDRINKCDSIIETEPPEDKYTVNYLHFEITRQCNLKCAFCLRGQQQNIVMSSQVIDSAFDKIVDVKTIGITGGEPLLAIDTLEYLINKLINSNWTTKAFSIITNGTIVDQRIVKLLSTLCIKKNLDVFLSISTDIFHWESKNNVAITQINTMKYYQRHFEKLGLYVDSLENTKGIHVVERNPEHKSISYIGLAKDLIDNAFMNGEINIDSGIAKYKGYIPIVDITSDDSLQKYAHRISVKNNIVGCTLNITVNGDITNLQDCDYQTIDKYNFGNIQNDSFEAIIDKHNEQAVFDCWETNNVIRLYSQLKFNCFNKKIMPFVRLQVCRYEAICFLRKLIKVNFPDYDMSYIIEKLSIPTESEWIDILVDLYNSIYYKRIKPIDSIFDLSYSLMQEFVDMLSDSMIKYDGKYSMYLNKSAEELFYNSDLLKQFDISL